METIIIKLDGKPVGIVNDPGHGADVIAWFHRNKPSCSMSHAIEHEGYSTEEGEPDCGDVAALIGAIAEREGLTMSATFVPFSQSRNAKPDGAFGKAEPWESLNWRCKFERHGREILTQDYGQGVAYAPAYARKWENEHVKQRAISLEIETGRVARAFMSPEPKATAKAIEPPAIGDVLQSLASDASAIDERGFEDWASSLGYDTDSRSAESIYRECIGIATALQAGLGGAVVAEIRLAASFN